MRAILIFVSAMMLLSSCNSLTPFTQDIYSDLDINNEDIKSVQFYLSQDIVLHKTLNIDEAKIEDGKIKLRERRKAKEILIAKGTPGVVVFLPKENRFAVSFEDDEDKFLIFGPNKKMDDRYTLLGKEWDDGYGEVTYGGEVYTTSTRNAIASLLVNVNKMNKYTVKRKQASGRKI